LDILDSSGIVACGEPVGDADGTVGVGVVNGVNVASGVAVGVSVGVGVGLGIGVEVTSGVWVGVGVEVASGVGVGVCGGFADGLQLPVRKAIRRREKAHRQILRFRSIVNKSFKTQFEATLGNAAAPVLFRLSAGTTMIRAGAIQRGGAVTTRDAMSRKESTSINTEDRRAHGEYLKIGWQPVDSILCVLCGLLCIVFIQNGTVGAPDTGKNRLRSTQKIAEVTKNI
jgi:hypothetical protein